MKNSYEKVNIGEFFDVKKEYLGGRDYSPMYVNLITEMNHPSLYSTR